MAKSKLKSALLRHQGIDIVAEKKKKISQRPSKKGKKSRGGREDSDEAPELVDISQLPKPVSKAVDKETDKEVAEEVTAADERGDEEDEDDEEEDPEASDVPLSDIESDNDLAVEDVIPHQKLTIDNHAALASLLKRIALPVSKMPFSEHQSIITDEPLAIDDIHDDLTRELAFYKQALDAAVEGRRRLKAEGVPFERPADYFAEMMKDDEHMGNVKAKLLEEVERTKRSQDAKKLRDLKKFGKQVQVAKLQERDKAKRDMLEKVQVLKRKRANADTTEVEGEDSMFDVALDEQTKNQTGNRRDKRAKRESTDKSRAKRQKKDKQYGHGGKKRFSKSGDAVTSGDLSGFSQKKNSSGFGKKGGKAMRLGKSKRQASRR